MLDEETSIRGEIHKVGWGSLFDYVYRKTDLFRPA